MAVRRSELHMVWICWWNYWNVAYDQVEMSKEIHMMKDFFKVVIDLCKDAGWAY